MRDNVIMVPARQTKHHMDSLDRYGLVEELSLWDLESWEYSCLFCLPLLFSYLPLPVMREVQKDSTIGSSITDGLEITLRTIEKGKGFHLKQRYYLFLLSGQQ